MAAAGNYPEIHSRNARYGHRVKKTFRAALGSPGEHPIVTVRGSVSVLGHTWTYGFRLY